MQRLAKEGWLEHVDYLSTVSGGGYIGGALTWLLSAKGGELNKGKAFGTTSAKFPYGVENPRKKRLREDESNILKHLRLHGKYLTPGKGITATSLIAVILRGILLNFLVWLPLAVALMVVLLFASYGFEHPSWEAIRNLTVYALKNGRGLGLLLWPAGIMGMAFLVASMLYSLATWRPILQKRYLVRRWVEKWIRWPLWLGLLFGSPGIATGSGRMAVRLCQGSRRGVTLAWHRWWIVVFRALGRQRQRKDSSRRPRPARLHPVFLWIGAGVVWDCPVLL